jgi:hypothetical protein
MYSFVQDKMTSPSKFVHALLAALALLTGSSAAAADCPALLNHTFTRLQDSAPLSLYRTLGEVIPELGTASFPLRTSDLSLSRTNTWHAAWSLKSSGG